MRSVLAWLVVGFVFVGWPASAEEDDPMKKANDAKLRTLQYPGSTLQSDHLARAIAQYEWVTPDSLEKVETWYRKEFIIAKSFVGGVADMPWPSSVKVTEAKGQQQWAIVQDDLRLKNDGTRNRDVRAGTMRAFVVRTPEHLLFTVLNRTPQDKQTLISVTVLNEKKK